MSEKTVFHIIPAQTGWYFLEPYTEFESYFKHPIIAWRIETKPTAQARGGPEFESDGFPVPVFGTVCNAEDAFILRPDGSVEEPYKGTWDSVESWWEEIQNTKSAGKRTASTDTKPEQVKSFKP